MISSQHLDEVFDRWTAAHAEGRDFAPEELCHECPELMEELRVRIEAVRSLQWLEQPLPPPDDSLRLPDFAAAKKQIAGDLWSTVLYLYDGSDFAAMEKRAIGERFPKLDVSLADLRQALTLSGLLTEQELDRALTTVPNGDHPTTATELAGLLIRLDKVTPYQLQRIATGCAEDLMLGNYLILDKIGEGGMGQVFKACHRRMKRIVAIKMLPAETVNSEQAVERFRREVELVARLDHPNIVTAHDADESQGRHFLVMQFVEGADLAALVAGFGPLQLGQAVAVLAQAARGLAYAHSKGIVHRDIKPGNLLIDQSGTLKILDLGLARLQNREGREATAPALTTDGSVMGTVDYMAPEQAVNTHDADERADIYSLGCTLFYTLMGRPPFGGSTVVARLLAHRDQAIPDLRTLRPDVPPGLVSIFERMLAKDPAERYPTMNAVLADLEADADVNASLHLPSDAYKLGSASGEFLDPPTGAVAFVKTSTTDADRTKNRDGMPPKFSANPSAKTRSKPTAARRPLLPILSTRGATVLLACLALGLAGLAGLFGIILRVNTPDGTLIVEVSDPAAVLSVDGQAVQVEVQGNGGKTSLRVAVDPGTHQLAVSTKDGISIPLDKDTVTIAAGKKTTVVARLERPVKPMLPAPAGSPIPTPAAMPAATIASASPLPKIEPPAPLVDRDRDAAEWILRSGGRVWLTSGKNFGSIAELPSSEFKVSMANFIGAKYETKDLDKLAGLASLRLIHFTSQPITDSDLERLQDLPKLEVLLIDDTRVTAAGVRALKRFPSLKEIYCGHFAWDRQLLSEVMAAHPGLTVLTLDASQLTAEDLASLAKLANLWTLHLAGSVGDDKVRAVCQIKSIRDLAFENNTTITDDGLRALAELPQLGTVVFYGDKYPKLTGAVLGILADTLPNLRNLGPPKKRFEVSEWEQLQRLPKLAQLTLGGSQQTDEVVPALAKLEQVEILRFFDTKVTQAGLEQLHAALPQCRVEHNWLGKIPSVESVQAAEKVAHVNKKLVELNPGYDGKAVAIMSGGRFTGLEFSTDHVSDISPIRDVSGIIKLKCRGSATGKGQLKDLSPLQGMPLTELDCAFNRISDLEALRGMPLTELTLTINPIKDLAALQGLPLERLEFNDNGNIADLSPLKGMRLKRLSCNGMKATDLSPLRGMPLEHLNIHSTAVADLSPLQGMPLIGIGCSGTKITDLSPLYECATLRYFDCTKTKVTPAAVAALQKALPECKIGWDDPSKVKTP